MTQWIITGVVTLITVYQLYRWVRARSAGKILYNQILEVTEKVAKNEDNHLRLEGNNEDNPNICIDDLYVGDVGVDYICSVLPEFVYTESDLLDIAEELKEKQIELTKRVEQVEAKANELDEAQENPEEELEFEPLEEVQESTEEAQENTGKELDTEEIFKNLKNALNDQSRKAEQLDKIMDMNDPDTVSMTFGASWFAGIIIAVSLVLTVLGMFSIVGFLILCVSAFLTDTYKLQLLKGAAFVNLAVSTTEQNPTSFKNTLCTGFDNLHENIFNRSDVKEIAEISEKVVKQGDSLSGTDQALIGLVEVAYLESEVEKLSLMLLTLVVGLCLANVLPNVF